MPRKKSRKPSKWTPICLAVDPDLLKQVDALCAQQDRSRGQMVRWLVLCELRRRRLTPPADAPPADAAESDSAVA